MAKKKSHRVPYSGGGCPGGDIDAIVRAKGRAPLTVRQDQAMRAICEHIEEHGWAPTYREIAAAMGWRSTAAAQQLVGVLERKGWLVRLPRAARAIKMKAEVNA
jgi:repressor LexA